MESLAGTPDSECSFLDTQIYDPRTYGSKRVSDIFLMGIEICKEKMLGEEVGHDI